jgi:hypothetical protein
MYGDMHTHGLSSVYVRLKVLFWGGARDFLKWLACSVTNVLVVPLT